MLAPRAPQLTPTRDERPLTRAEAEVASILADGWGNPEIAARLNKSEATIRHQIAAIMRKMGVKQRGRAVALLRGATIIAGERIPEFPRRLKKGGAASAAP